MSKRAATAGKPRAKRRTATAGAEGAKSSSTQIFVAMSAQVIDGDHQTGSAKKILTRLQVSELKTLCDKSSVILARDGGSTDTNEEGRQRMTMLLSPNPVEMYTEQVCLAVGPFEVGKARVFRNLWQTQTQPRGKAVPKLSVLSLVAKGIQLATEIKSETYADIPLVYALHQFGRSSGDTQPQTDSAQ
jgi:hypothetical protein